MGDDLDGILNTARERFLKKVRLLESDSAIRKLSEDEINSYKRCLRALDALEVCLPDDAFSGEYGFLDDEERIWDSGSREYDAQIGNVNQASSAMVYLEGSCGVAIARLYDGLYVLTSPSGLEKSASEGAKIVDENSDLNFALLEVNVQERRPVLNRFADCKRLREGSLVCYVCRNDLVSFAQPARITRIEGGRAYTNSKLSFPGSAVVVFDKGRPKLAGITGKDSSFSLRTQEYVRGLLR